MLFDNAFGVAVGVGVGTIAVGVGSAAIAVGVAVAAGGTGVAVGSSPPHAARAIDAPRANTNNNASLFTVNPSSLTSLVASIVRRSATLCGQALPMLATTRKTSLAAQSVTEQVLSALRDQPEQHRVQPGFHDVAERLLQSGFDVSYETVRVWNFRVAPMIPARLRSEHRGQAAWGTFTTGAADQNP